MSDLHKLHSKGDLTGLFTAFLAEQRHLDDVSSTLTACLDFLRHRFPNEAVNALMCVVWDVIEYRYVPAAMGPEISDLCWVYASARSGSICAPTDWPERVQRDVFSEMGALVRVGSHAVDCYNERSEWARFDRARAYEAEFLRTLQDTESFRPDVYQQVILDKYPYGVRTDSVREHIYTSKVVVP